MELLLVSFGGLIIWMLVPRERFSTLFSIYLSVILILLYFDSDVYTTCVWNVRSNAGNVMCHRFKTRW